jgi:GAF domain-containing protein
MTPEQLSERMAQLARGLKSERTSPDTLEHIVRSAVDLMEPCGAAGISVAHDGSDARDLDEINTVATTDARAKRSDEIQVEVDEGPCIAPTWEGDLLLVPDLRSDPRWPRWARQVVEELDVQSVLCLRLFTYEGRYGVLNLYSSQPNGLAPADLQEEALAIAAHAAVALAAIEEIEDVTLGPMPRTIIGQATGILMERYSTTDMGAFDMLVQLASDGPHRIVEIARQIVADRNAQ